ncbi:MAG: hypothetical protein AB8G96_13345 [Phycisphaerales bacterium]
MFDAHSGTGRRFILGIGAALVWPAMSAMGSIVIESGDPGNPFDDQILDVRASIGLGMNASYLVVDFRETGGDAYAWEYRWNPGDAATGLTMLQAMNGASDLAVDLVESDFGVFVGNFELGLEGEVGDPDAFWQYFTAEAEDIDPGVDWTSSLVGVADRALSNGSLDGWVNSFAVGTADPTVPTVTIPAPAGLAAFAGLFLVGNSRRRSD